MLLGTLGRTAGISGILGGFVGTLRGARSWRLPFLLGLVIGVWLAGSFFADAFVDTLDRSLLSVAVAGLLVGYGTQLGSGCTSGHGVCGLSNLSARSLVAVLTFMLTGGITVYVARHILGVLG